MRYHGGRTPEEDGHACRQIRVGRNQSVYGVCIWEGDNDVWEASAAAITEIEKEHIEDDGRLILDDQQQEMIMTELCQQQSVSFNAMSQQSSGSSGTQVVGFQPGHHGVNGGTRVFGFQPGCTEGTESTQQKRPFSLLSVAAVDQASGHGANAGEDAEGPKHKFAKILNDWEKEGELVVPKLKTFMKTLRKDSIMKPCHVHLV